MQTLKVNDLNIKYRVVKRNVKYWRLEIKEENLFLIAPKGYKNHEEILEKHKGWIYKKFKAIEIKKKEAELKKINLNVDEEKFKDLIHKLVNEYSIELNTSVNRVYFKKMKSRWGSCSSRKNVSINILLKYMPQNLIEYVVFHEIAHLVELNHSKRFWSLISSKFPDYKDLEKELSIYWIAVKER
ncbi:M48 family metallopeptidase [Methanobacterium oryzae]|uniref:M48 family metallopeptidase n=1 Tax=Methanobacterium oryzae TaxID=69540 RepID=UPI003D1AC779